MKKFVLSFLKNFPTSITGVFLIPLLILFFSSPLLTDQKTFDPPPHYGYFIKKDGNWVEIPELTTTRKTPLKGECRQWGISGLDSKPQLKIENSQPTIYLYDPNVTPQKIKQKLKLYRLWYFEKLRAADFYGQTLSPESFEQSCVVERDRLLPFGKWTSVGQYGIKTFRCPSFSHIICIHPPKNLPSGIFALYKGPKFTSCPTSTDTKIKMRVFEIKGQKIPPPKLQPSETPRVEFTRVYISNKLQRIETLKSSKTQFSVSSDQLACYVKLRITRSGEIMDLIWIRPDGTVEARERKVIGSLSSEDEFSCYQKINLSHLLMPGKWLLAIKVYGRVEKIVPFSVKVK